MRNAVVLAILMTGCATKVAVNRLYQCEAVRLPPGCSNPDGMTLGRDANVYVAINNAGADLKFSQPGRILRITPRDKVEEVCELPKHPQTQIVCPRGICFGPDGHLYVCDNQMLANNPRGRSRILRIRMSGHKPQEIEVVATGLNAPNGIAARSDALYVCEGSLDDEFPMHSGVYRLALSELDPANPARLGGKSDPRLIFTLQTRSKEHRTGANGIAFDAKGNLYISNFGDAEVWKLALDSGGKVVSAHLLVRGSGLESADGLYCDTSDTLWVADFLGNAVATVSTRTGQVNVLAKNPVSDGAYGELDAPRQCVRRGDKVYVSNSDLPTGRNKTDAVQTITVINLRR
ncbi:MAG: SMP-30/gluconolactonase/LRE family protein [Verrucomicrobiae bacterium]|nr:SMP-30/gluconolactonase/LRE family protein [Verrucomicrobiae bacterium]